MWGKPPYLLIHCWLPFCAKQNKYGGCLPRQKGRHSFSGAPTPRSWPRTPTGPPRYLGCEFSQGNFWWTSFRWGPMSNHVQPFGRFPPPKQKKTWPSLGLRMSFSKEHVLCDIARMEGFPFTSLVDKTCLKSPPLAPITSFGVGPPLLSPPPPPRVRSPAGLGALLDLDLVGHEVVLQARELVQQLLQQLIHLRGPPFRRARKWVGQEPPSFPLPGFWAGAKTNRKPGRGSCPMHFGRLRKEQQNTLSFEGP